MFEQFEGFTADEVWQKIATTFRNLHSGMTQDSRAGSTQEILHAAITIRDPRQRWVASRFPPLNPAFAIAEVIWILCGRNDSQFLTYWNSQLPKFAGSHRVLHGAYGYRLREHLGFDQLDRAYLALKQDPNSRQVVLQIWDGIIDFPDESGMPRSEDIPCNVIALLKVRNGKLEWTQIIRSNDFFLGLPHNLVQFTCLQEVLSGWLSLELGSYHQISDSLHVYERDWLAVTSFEPVNALRNPDSLAIPKAESDELFTELSNYAAEMTATDLSEHQISRHLKWNNGPPSFRNLLLVLIAECGRRRGWRNVCADAISLCTNDSLTQMWNRWLSRVGHRTLVTSERS